jgi:RNA polymerase sigma-54 factor
MGPAIALRLRQHLTLTPQVQQALRLLQMSALEFAQEMEQALAANPFLEENPEAPAPVPGTKTAEGPVEDVVLPQEAAAPPSDREQQDDWGGGADAPPTLQEHLREQLRMSRLGDRDRALAEMVIDSLDDDGYFKASFEELAALLPKEHDVAPEEFVAALKLVQSLDPPGIAARTLDECLRLQLENLPADTPARQIAIALTSHLSLLGHRFGANEARYVIPDVLVRRSRERWMALINPASLPRLRLNRAYADALGGRNGSNHSLARHLQEARWLLRSIEQRFATIQRVADAIVARQRGFFEYGEVAMKPLTLKLIAGELGLHESTVCRVTNNKYMATPRGLFEFKHFFSRRLATENGGAASATAVRAVMKELIAAEDPRAPLSDAELARLLAQQGLRVARRTITKYRALMRMPSVDVRRADRRSA